MFKEQRSDKSGAIVRRLRAMLVKLAIASSATYGAWRVWYTMPDKVLRRKLYDLFRRGDLYYKYQGYKGKELRDYPRIKHVTTFIDRREIVFTIPIGLDPKIVIDKEYLFQQTYGSLIELSCDDDSSTFVLTIYNTAMDQFLYDTEEVDKLITKDMLVPMYIGKSRKGDIVG